MRIVFFKQLAYHCACQSPWLSWHLSSHEHPNQTWGVKDCHQICKHNSIVFLCKHLLALCFFVLLQFCTCSGGQVFFCHSFNCLSEFPYHSKSLKVKPPRLKLCVVSTNFTLNLFLLSSSMMNKTCGTHVLHEYHFKACWNTLESPKKLNSIPSKQ